MKFLDAFKKSEAKLTSTENGIATLSGSSNACVDLFFQAAAMRGQNRNQLIALFDYAYAENPRTAMKILFWIRDIRGGAGERQIFRDIAAYSTLIDVDVIRKNMKNIAEYGRWDDILIFMDTELERSALRCIAAALNAEDGLCAKWMPRKGEIANKIRKYMRMDPKSYRKMLVRLTEVVESQMCARQWQAIDYNKVPSLASARYQKAFMRNDERRYQKYINKLSKGEAKINASAVYPYDILKSLTRGEKEVAELQWQSLPNWVAESNKKILPIVDVSGSMCCPAGGNANVTCMDVAVSLGLFIAERNKGLFKDAFISFSANPQMHFLKGSLEKRYNQIMRSDWGMNTNVQAVFELILSKAKSNRISQSEMPDQILILSDMEFDVATNSGHWDKIPDWNQTAQEMIERKFSRAGYRCPQIVYWNIQSRQRNVPVRYDKSGTALVSGFSPAIMHSLAKGKEFNPKAIMNETIYSSRYNAVVI